MNNYEFSIITNEYCDTKKLAETLKAKLLKYKVQENILDPNIVFVIGGDGTFLKAVNQYNNKLAKIQFVNFNKGKIGFYHDFLIAQMDQVLADLFNDKNKFVVNELDLLEINTNDKKYYCVNEVRLVNFAQTLNCQIDINDELLEVFRGTGLVISTKTGSTGLMKTMGAAVILANEKIMEMQEIFPVNNNLYRTLRAPIILGQDQIITLKINPTSTNNNDNEQLVVDTFIIRGKLIEIKVQLSKLSLKILAYQKQEKSLIKKLNRTFIEFKK